MSNQSKVHTLTLLPWLKLGCDLEMGKYSIIRWPRDDDKFRKFKQSLNSICSMYKYVDGRVEHPQTIIINQSLPIFERIEEKERENIQEAVTILTVALIGENEFFRSFGNYVNSSLTELHFQNFSIGDDSVAFTSYKRDGNTTDMGYEFDEITISTPPGCRTRTGCKEINKDWLDTLGTILEKKNPLDRLIIEASDLFKQANTDSPTILHTSEVVMMANAFDRLFPDANGKYQLSESISNELDMYTTIDIDKSYRLKEKNVVPSQIDARCENWSLVKYWMFELYSLRSDYVHGNDIKRHKWGWIPLEHLLLGAFIFPLLLKVLLSKEKRYILSEEDIYKLSAIDNLIDLFPFYKNDTHRNLWQEKINEVRFNKFKQ